MWYHYANIHNGVCIELKIPKHMFEVVKMGYDTKYTIDRNKIHITTEEAKKFLSHKSICGKYEDEKRIFYIK